MTKRKTNAWTAEDHRYLRQRCEQALAQCPRKERRWWAQLFFEDARLMLRAVSEIERLRALVEVERANSADLHQQIHELLEDKQRP